MKQWIALCALYVCGLHPLLAQQPVKQLANTQLANTTLLVIRHAEKPNSGRMLAPDGVKRAQRYIQYFEPFRAEGLTVSVNTLFAGADSKNSVRPRLTLEPLSRATGMPLDVRFGTNQPELLAHALATEPHGDHVLIAWRHEKIPALLQALGANPQQLLPGAAWPDNVYDWVIVLRYDSTGRLEMQERIQEPSLLAQP